MIVRLFGATALLTLLATPALAEESHLEGWFDGSVVVDVGDRSFVQLQTQQRARGSGNPTGDLQLYRLWVGRTIGGVQAMAGLNWSKEGTTREVRLIQQAGYTLGVKGLRGRTRLEQRFVEDSGRTGWRLRQRVGFALPLTDAEQGWKLTGNAEGFWTLRATSRDGQTGVTGFRTFIGFERSLGRVDLGAGYTRQQSLRKGAPDQVGHAPTLFVTLNL